MLPQAQRSVLPLDGARAAAAQATPWLAAQAQALPDQLSLAQRRPDVRLRYWLDVSPCTGGPAMLYLFRVGAPYRAYAYGADATPRQALDPWLPRAGVVDRVFGTPGERVRNGRVPVVLDLPPGTRWLELELSTVPYIPTGLISAQLGPVQPLAARQASDFEFLSRGSDLVAGISIFIGLVAVMLSLRRPLDAGLRWFAAGCSVWGLRNLLYLNPTLPGEGYAAEMFLSFGVVFCGVSMAICALYAASLARPALVRWLRAGLLALLGAFCLSLLAPALSTPTRALSFVGTMVAMGTAAWVLLRERAQASGVSAPVQNLLGLAVLGQIVAGGHDFGIVLGLRPPDSPALAFWGFSFLVLALALISGARIVAALGRAENTNTELEQRVADKNAELQRSYAAVRDTELLAERRLARAQERERLNREIHDGLGAQLITALRGVERGALSKEQVAEALQEGLDELRLLMDASDLGRSLHGALVAWRNRWDARLYAVGINLRWQMAPTLEQLELGSDATLQIMRVLQEATTNAVKHAQASEVSVCAQLLPGQLQLEVSDNGVGLPETAGAAPGRGLRNMQQRAQQLGGSLQVHAIAAPLRGTRVLLCLDLDAAAAPSQPMPLAPLA